MLLTGPQLGWCGFGTVTFAVWEMTNIYRALCVDSEKMSFDLRVFPSSDGGTGCKPVVGEGHASLYC